MMIAALKVGLVLGLVLGFFVPLVHWAGGRMQAAIAGRARPRGAALMGDPLSGLFQPLADALKWLSKRPRSRSGGVGLAQRLAPVAAVVVPLLALVVVPFAGRYRLGAHTPDFVIADLDWGVGWLIATALLSVYGAVLAGWGGAGFGAVLGGVRAAAQLISFPVVVALALTGLLMVYGSLSPQEIVLAQDTVFAPLAGLGAWLPSGVGAVLDRIAIPRWGVATQPLAFVLLWVGFTIESLTRPFDAPRAGAELACGPVGEESGAGLLLFVLAQHIRTVVFACIIVTLFLGGWSIPYLPTGAIIGSIATWYGTGFATLICIALHLATFLAKVVFVIAAAVFLPHLAPRMRVDQTVAFCWTVLLPLAALNVGVTAVFLALHGGAS